MGKDIRKYIPTIITAVAGILVFLVIPSQIDLSRVRSGNVTGVNSRTIPYVLSILIVSLSAVEFIFTKKKSNHQDEKQEKNGEHSLGQVNYAAYVRVCVTMVIIYVWTLLMPVLGFVISLFILMVCIMVLMGNKRWITMVVVSLITTLALRYVFTVFIGRSLPTGIFF